MTLSQTTRVTNSTPSSIRVMFDLAEQADHDLVRLEVGQPDFQTPAHIIDAATAAAKNGHTGYTANAGIPELRAAVAEMLQSSYGVPATPDGVTITVGGMEALHLAMLATVEPGQEVLLPSPVWPNYPMQATLAGGTPVEVPLSAETGYALDADAVIERMGPETAAVVLCTPSNPTGRVFDEKPVRAVVDAAAAHDVAVIADEVYLGLTYDRAPRGIAGYVDEHEHVLTIGSVSKTHAMTGWRLGWIAGDPAFIDGVNTIHESTTSCAPSIVQHAALAALTGPQEPVVEMYETFKGRRELVVDRIAEIDGLSAPDPQAAFYAFIEPELSGSSLSIAKRLLSEFGVVLAPGDGFGTAGKGRLRLSFANSTAQIEEGFDRIETALRSW